MKFKYLGLSILGSLSLMTGCSIPDDSDSRLSGHYTSKTPYQAKQDWREYSAPPAGFEAVMVQHVARHGSRGLSSPDDDDLMWQLWQQAHQEGALTERGEALGPVLQEVLAVHQVLGYGQLSRLGEIEHEQMAERLLQRHPDLFEQAANEQRRIRVSHSGRSRAADSGEAFIRGLVSNNPKLQPLIDEAYAHPPTLYFHKAEGSEGYDDYRDNDPRLIAAMQQIENDPRTREVARNIMLQLFADDFVERLVSGHYQFIAADDESDQINDELDATMALYGLYSIGINLTEEADLQLERFIDEEHAAWLAYVDDADSFYGRGPGFIGDDITYRAADTLVDTMLSEIESLATGDASYAASVRFTHAQVLMPLATWFQFENATQAVTADELYTYDNNPWRGGELAPMGSNVQWDVYSNSEEFLVRMLHNEREVSFPAGCETYNNTDYFYQLQEIRRCLGDIQGI